MKKIIILCKEGVSAVFMKERLHTLLSKQSQTMQIITMSMHTVGENDFVDAIVFLAPQIRYAKPYFVDRFPNTMFFIIDIDDYASLNADAILTQMKQLL